MTQITPKNIINNIQALNKRPPIYPLSLSSLNTEVGGTSQYTESNRKYSALSSIISQKKNTFFDKVSKFGNNNHTNSAALVIQDDFDSSDEN